MASALRKIWEGASAIFFSSSSPSIAPMEDTIRNAFQRDLFKPYEAELKRPKRYGSRSWFDLIQNIVQPKRGGNASEHSARFLSYQFALAIDPDIKEEDKRAFLSNEQRSLTPEQARCVA